MSQHIRLGTISIDCQDPARLRDFYADLLGWQRGDMYNWPSAASDDVVLLFMNENRDYVSPVWPEQPGAQQKQIHLDFQADDVPAAVAKAESLGATRADLHQGDAHWVVMRDPEGHVFCVCESD